MLYGGDLQRIAMVKQFIKDRELAVGYYYFIAREKNTVFPPSAKSLCQQLERAQGPRGEDHIVYRPRRVQQLCESASRPLDVVTHLLPTLGAVRRESLLSFQP